MAKHYSRTHIVGGCGVYEEERDVLEGEMRKIVECDMEKFGTLDSEKTIAILGDRWWPKTAKQEGDEKNIFFPCDIRKKRNERLTVGVSIGSRNGALSRKGSGVNSQNDEGKQQMSTPPPQFDAVLHVQENPPKKQFFVGCSSPFMQLA